MEFKEFKQLVNRGVEYNFDIEDVEYWISQNNDGYLEQLWTDIQKYCS